MALSAATEAALDKAGLESEYVEDLVRRAIVEDLAGGVDVTSVATVPVDQEAVGHFVVREAGVVAGLPVARAVLDVLGGVRVETCAADGSPVGSGAVLMTVRGLTRTLLTAERTSLNLLCHLSGIATLTRRWVGALDGTGAMVRDTRKTTPGLRALEKYAVRCGGGANHRMSLSDAGLVKDNHVLAAGGVRAAFEAVRTRWPELPVEVEADTLEQVREAVSAGADLVLLDNMSTSDIRRAVEIARPGGVLLEASGGLTLDRAREVGETGVNYLAVGALTHSAPALDIGLDLSR